MPPHLLELFTPDWEKHWKMSVAQVLGRLFKAVGWPEELEFDESEAVKNLLCRPRKKKVT